VPPNSTAISFTVIINFKNKRLEVKNQMISNAKILKVQR
jgi:hypothetical protein